jgi:hypothetical protein
MKNLERIKTIGFELAGHWALKGGEINYIQEPSSKKLWGSPNALYAFIVEKTGEILYIGKTTRTPIQRFFGYKRPGNTQATNKKVNAEIISLIKKDNLISIYLFSGTMHLRWGEFSVNLAAGLEDQLIKVISPRLNGKVTESETIEFANLELANEGLADDTSKKNRFTIALGDTYLTKGFINPGISLSKQLDQNIQLIDIYLGKNSKSPLRKKIDWKANHNGSARISGGKDLVVWYQENGCIKGDEVTGVIENPTAIRLLKKVA